jgi:hypothetical protein
MSCRRCPTIESSFAEVTVPEVLKLKLKLNPGERIIPTR